MVIMVKIVKNSEKKNSSKWYKMVKMVKHGGPDLKRARRTGLSARRAGRMKLRGLKGLQLEVWAQRAPRLLVCTIYTNVHKYSVYIYIHICSALHLQCTCICTSEQMPSIIHNGDTGWGEGPLVSLPGKSLSEIDVTKRVKSLKNTNTITNTDKNTQANLDTNRAH